MDKDLKPLLNLTYDQRIEALRLILLSYIALPCWCFYSIVKIVYNKAHRLWMFKIINRIWKRYKDQSKKVNKFAPSTYSLSAKVQGIGFGFALIIVCL